jgi:hypothetical protein
MIRFTVMGSLLLFFIVIASTLVFLSDTAQAQNSRLEEACRGEITKKLREWTVTSVTAEVTEWSKSHRLNPTVIHGDFDGDSNPDIALLIQNRAKAVLDYPERAYSSLVAVCLSRRSRVVLHLIDDPYCSDLIELSRKGQRYYDFETDKTGAYLLDGVKTVCFEKASATYIYDRNRVAFRRIVDGD